MPHVLVAGKLHPSGRELLMSAPDLTIDFVEEVSEQSDVPLIDRADALLIRTQPMSAATVAKADKLKIVSRHGVGYDAVDVAALNQRGIALAVCGDVNSTSVAEHAVMMMLAAAKRLVRADASVRKGPWEWRNRLESQDVRGRDLLLLIVVLQSKLLEWIERGDECSVFISLMRIPSIDIMLSSIILE